MFGSSRSVKRSPGQRREMARPRSGSRSDEVDEPDEEEEDEPPRRRSPSRRAPHARPRPPKRWKGPEEEEEAGEDEATPAGRHWFGRKPVFWRARDSLYFEPLVALAIVVVLLAGLYAYTQNWPPIYVVESDSMQHGNNDILGLINTGDLVLAQRIPTSQVVPYVVGLTSGYRTYGEFGDVLLYYPNGNSGATPIIHRAIVYLDWDASSGTYSAPELNGLPCGTPGAVYATPGTTDPANCATSGLKGTLDLYTIGWQSVNVTVSLSSPALGEHSGFLTMGDKNTIPDQLAGFSQLVEPGWIIGVARGMIPWFGAVKLLLEGQAGMVPPQSWQFLGLTVAGIILLAFGIHYALRAEGIESAIRREEEEEAREEDEDDEEEVGRGRRWLRSLRPWHRGEEEDDDVDDAPAHRRTSSRSSKTSPSGSRRGRPRPKVRRAEKGTKSSDEDL